MELGMPFRALAEGAEGISRGVQGNRNSPWEIIKLPTSAR